MGKTFEERYDQLTEKNKKLHKFIKQLQDDCNKKDALISQLQSQKRSKNEQCHKLNQELNIEKKKYSEEKGKWEQKFKIQKETHQEISKGISDERFKLIQSNESKDDQIIKLTERISKLECVNKDLEAKMKQEANDKHYYFVKFKKLQDSFTEIRTSSTVHNSSPMTSFSATSSPLPVLLPPQSPLHCKPSPFKDIQRAPKPLFLRDFTQNMNNYYATHREVIKNRMIEISRLHNKTHQNITECKMKEFLNDLEKLPQEKDQKTFSKVEKYYRNQVKGKVAWIKPKVNKRTDPILYHFLDQIELAVIHFNLDGNNK